MDPFNDIVIFYISNNLSSFNSGPIPLHVDLSSASSITSEAQKPLN